MGVQLEQLLHRLDMVIQNVLAVIRSISHYCRLRSPRPQPVRYNTVATSILMWWHIVTKHLAMAVSWGWLKILEGLACIEYCIHFICIFKTCCLKNSRQSTELWLLELEEVFFGSFEVVFINLATLSWYQFLWLYFGSQMMCSSHEDTSVWDWIRMLLHIRIKISNNQPE
jgi:hypothetical protein